MIDRTHQRAASTRLLGAGANLCDSGTWMRLAMFLSVALTAVVASDAHARAPIGAREAPGVCTATPTPRESHEATTCAAIQLATPISEVDRWRPRIDKPIIHASSAGPACRARRAPYSVAELDPTYAACRAEPSWAHGLVMPDFAIVDLDQLEPYVRWFTQTKAGRGVVQRWVRRAGRHRAHVQAQLAAQGLPRSLEALVFVESGYSPLAHSHAGAVGLWQLMPATARALGLQIDEDCDERRSIDGATTAALKHLVRLQRKFGSWELVLAAYDYGEGRLQKKLREHDVVDFWSLAAIPGVLPRETLEYVPKLLAFALVLRNFERFGFDPKDVEPLARATRIEVPTGTRLALVAHAASTSVRELRLLNPELTGERVPGGVESMRVPARSSAHAKAMLPHVIAAASRGEEPLVDEGFDWGDEGRAEAVLAAATAKAKAKANASVAVVVRPARGAPSAVSAGHVKPKDARAAEASATAANRSKSAANKANRAHLDVSPHPVAAMRVATGR